ncbi:MAG TPA: spirocyclase AveC family protein [Acidimicrobiia bacterium]|nr:spirocyclase AveC family protein [Acidimicrobiia bacterium]
MGGAAFHPLFGLRNWPAVFEWGSVVVALGFWGVFIALSRRAGRMHPGLALVIALTGVGVLEPAANWSCYCAYDPRLHHFPTSWPYFRLAPVVQPLVTVIAYPYYLMFPALVAFGLWRGMSHRLPAGHPVNRHPLVALLAGGYAVGVVFDLVAQFALFPSGVLVWTQIAGPAIRSGQTTQYPLLTTVIWPVFTAVTTLFLWRDDTGRTIAAPSVDRIGARRRPLAEVGVAWAALCLTYGIWIGAFGVIRWSGQAKTLARPWPFAGHRIFDPDGYYKAAGETGAVEGSGR